jgi:hypothetical protein
MPPQIICSVQERQRHEHRGQHDPDSKHGTRAQDRRTTTARLAHLDILSYQLAS